MDTFENEYLNALDRKNNPVEGSYTNYLYNKGTEKICKKVGEEATEVVIAAMKQDKKELIGELCDLYYHAVVLMVDQGVSLEDVKAELDQRALKAGNLKPERKPIEKR